LKRVLQKRVLNELSKQILAGTINNEDRIEVDIDKQNNFSFRNVKEESVEA
jgi:ATP-dependent Clp protease ATP-binding subunit ClpB